MIIPTQILLIYSIPRCSKGLYRDFSLVGASFLRILSCGSSSGPPIPEFANLSGNKSVMSALGNGDEMVESLLKNCIVEVFKPDDPPVQKQTLALAVPASGSATGGPVIKSGFLQRLGLLGPKPAPKPIAASAYEALPRMERVDKVIAPPPGFEGARPNLNSGLPRKGIPRLQPIAPIVHPTGIFALPRGEQQMGPVAGNNDDGSNPALARRKAQNSHINCSLGPI